MLNHYELKAQSKLIMRNSRPLPLSVSFAYLLVCVVLGYLSQRIMGTNVTVADAEKAARLFWDADYYGAMALLQKYQPETGAAFIDLLLQGVSTVMSFGFLIFIINTVRRNGACLGNLLDGFGIVWRVLWLEILMGLFIMLWSLLFIVPGIIAAYKYRMAPYLLIDHPEMRPMECIRESKRMMNGHKGDLFLLDLSFIGWTILGIVPIIGYAVQLYTLPYFRLTYTLYYEGLCGRIYTASDFPPQDPENKDGGNIF